MFIRKAEEKDIPRILELLGQVLQIHADIRPDIFISGTTKYTTDELTELLKNEEKPVYVAADEADVCVGYAFCQLKEQPFSNNMVPFQSLFIDDLCIDREVRGQHIGERLFEYVKQMKGNYKEIETFIGKYIIKELNRLNKVCQFMFFDLDENDPNMIPFLNSFTFYLELLNNWEKAKK